MDITISNQARMDIRDGLWLGPTPSLAPGFTQANLIVLPSKYAFDFLLFCHRNAQACPVIDVCEAGSYQPFHSAPDGDLRTDLPKYYVYRNGVLVSEKRDIIELWTEDMVSFLLGCSFTFETALRRAGIPVRHIEEGKNVPMYITNIECNKAGLFQGPMVVSMRPIPAHMIALAVQTTARFPKVHGAPIHLGNPLHVGIMDLNKPDFGDAVTIHPGEIPVFWACGVTPQAAIMRVKLDQVITHAPGHMFITDLRDEEMTD